jgi:hypothetical protein
MTSSDLGDLATVGDHDVRREVILPSEQRRAHPIRVNWDIFGFEIVNSLGIEAA